MELLRIMPKVELIKEGMFSSDTDTEVLINLIEEVKKRILN
jgi:glucosamine 6-phosphate synthetase-like amidotransferase/phosphosugar isomerase protein